MAGATFKPNSQAPRAIPSPQTADQSQITRGVPKESAPQNHLAVAESFTTSAEIVQSGEYQPAYVEQMLAFFDRPKMREIFDTYTWKSGAVSEKVRYVPNTPPHFSEFARSIGVTTRKLKAWAKKYPEFGEAYETCQEIFEEFLIDNGLTGSYGAIAMKFVAVNRSKMKDKQVHENQTVNLNDVLDKIAAGQIKPGGLVDTGDDY